MAISYRAAQTLIKRSDEPALRAALNAGLEPNQTNQNGWSLLMLAAVEGAVPLGRLLLDAGAGIDSSNRHGETALSLAAQKGHLPFMKLLLEHGASPACKPHGEALTDWLRTASSLPPATLAEVLEALQPSHEHSPVNLP